MKIDGGCHCGQISYEAEIDPDTVGLCHCTDCQTFSGSAFRIGVPAAEGSFEITRGAPKTYIKTAESGGKRIQAFCAECGTALAAAGPKFCSNCGNETNGKFCSGCGTQAG